MQEASDSPSLRSGDAPDGSRPLLVYDADCAFCVFWARYWHKLTADAVHYRPYQDAAAHLPEIALVDFQRAVQYIPPEGRHASAAEASFLTLSHAPGKGFWLALYRKLPGFAAISELIYAFIAAHRAAFYRISLFLWGRAYGPPRYDLVSLLFLRLFGLIYLAAFMSFGAQALGLIGSHGILPLAELVEAIGGRAGTERFFVMPMLFWISASGGGYTTISTLTGVDEPDGVVRIQYPSDTGWTREAMLEFLAGVHVGAGAQQGLG